MRWSQTFIPTLKEDPTDAEVISHKLLVRAGMIRQVSRGIYDYLPLVLKIIRKIENIVREEMDRAGAQELLLPIASPAELWQQSGRWEIYGKELVRFKDRHERDFCLGPTHEEVIIDLVRRTVRSYRELPFNLYQIQTKFRDEVRPRFATRRRRRGNSRKFLRPERKAWPTWRRFFDYLPSGLSRLWSTRRTRTNSSPYWCAAITRSTKSNYKGRWAVASWRSPVRLRCKRPRALPRDFWDPLALKSASSRTRPFNEFRERLPGPMKWTRTILMSARSGISRHPRLPMFAWRWPVILARVAMRVLWRLIAASK